MFDARLNTLITSENARAQMRVEQLCLLSRECERHAIHPAQGLRLGRRAQIQDTSTDIATCIANGLVLLQEERRTVCAPQLVQPDHYLLRTQLPNTPNNAHPFTITALEVYPDIHFVRTQRRYNKRRYARVRAVSRPSFGSGMMLSTVMTGAFGGSTLQQTDWMTTLLVTPDPSFVILVGYVGLVYKASRLIQRVNSPRYREYNKARRGGLLHLPLY